MAHFFRHIFKRGIITPEDIYHERYSGQFKCEKCAQWWKSVHPIYGSQIFCPNCQTRIYGSYRSTSYKSDVVYVDGQYRFKAEYKHRKWTNLMENISDKQYEDYFGSPPSSSSSALPSQKEEESDSSGGHIFGKLMFAAVLGYFVYSFMEDY